MKFVAIATLALVVGCGSVASQNAPDAGKDADAVDVGGAPDLALPVHDAGAPQEVGVEARPDALGADSVADVDAVGADADAGDRLQAEVGQPEAPAADLITGTWSFNFTPNRGNGEMMLALAGKLISGTYVARNLPPEGTNGAGAITGTVEGDTLTLAFTGSITASVTAKLTLVGDHARVANGDGEATIAGKTYGFMGAWASK